MKKLLHKDIFMPKWIIDACHKMQQEKKDYVITDHFLYNRSGLDDKHNVSPEKLIKIANSLAFLPANPFEVEITQKKNRKWEITKFVVRVPYDNSQDISIVFRDNKIITCWLNNHNDNHFTLKVEKYNTKL